MGLLPWEILAERIDKRIDSVHTKDMTKNQTTPKPCSHRFSTLVEVRGLGSFDPVEVYACDECGHRSEIRLLHEAEDSGFAPESDES